jgi:hypothetical protein
MERTNGIISSLLFSDRLARLLLAHWLSWRLNCFCGRSNCLVLSAFIWLNLHSLVIIFRAKVSCTLLVDILDSRRGDQRTSKLLYIAISKLIKFLDHALLISHKVHRFVQLLSSLG